MDAERFEWLLIGQHLASREALVCALQNRFSPPKIFRHGTGRDVINISPSDVIAFDASQLVDRAADRSLHRLAQHGDSPS